MLTSPGEVGTRVQKIVSTVLGDAAPSAGVDEHDELSWLGIESLNILDIIVRIEEEFGLETDDNEIFQAQLTRVGDLTELVRSHL